MSAVRTKHLHRGPLHRGGGAVALSAVFVAVAGLLCGVCDYGDASVSVRPTQLVLVEATQPTGQAAQAPPPIPNPAPAVMGVGATQPEGAIPTIEFVGPRPPELPFRMDFTVPPDPPDVMELSPISPVDAIQARLRRVLRAEIARYPSGTMDKIGAIFIGGTLTLNGRSASGMYLPGIVFIAAGEQDAGATTDAHVVQTFHHEVSSLLLLEHQTTKFDEARFRASLPAGFVYRNDRPGANKGAPFGPDEFTVSLDLLDDGFLVPWAMRNLEQDFNSYAEVLMWKPELLLATFAPDSRIGRKARVVRDFYIAIDKRFEAVFAPAPPGGK